MEKGVRMADIAQRLGISIVSVSKGLSGKEGVSDEMRAKIIDTAKEMGYIAPTPKKKKEDENKNIGVLVCDRFFNETSFYSNLYRHVVKYCIEQGYACILEIVSPEDERDCVMPLILVRQKVDALIFMGEIDRRYMGAAIKFGLPFLLLDFYDEMISADSVCSDNLAGGYMMTEHLLQTGRTKIGYVGSITSTSSIMDRYLGYCKALLRHGIEPNPAWRLEDRRADGTLIPLQLPEEMPQAFVCNCDECAFNLTEKLRREGYRVPQDVAVTGYDDYRWATINNPPLTSYRVDLEAMAKAATDQLRRKLQHKPVPAPSVMVPGAFVRREST